MEHTISNINSQSRFAPGVAARTPVIGDTVWRWLAQCVGMNIAIAAFCLLSIGAIWIAVVIQTQSERAQTIANAIRQNANLVMGFEEQTIRTIKGVEAAARFIAHEYARLRTKIDLTKYIEDGFIDGKLIVNLGVVDERGDMLVSSQPKSGPINVADREYFRVHMQQDSGKLYFSKPVVSRITGKWTFPMTWRISKPDGSFGGIVSAAVAPDHFNEFYQKADLGQDGMMDLVGLDGVSRVRRSLHFASFGLDMSNSNLLKEQAKSGVGSFLNAGRIEGIKRYESFRTIPGYPLVVAVGTSQEEVLAGFLRKRNHEYWVALLFTAVILSFAALLIAVLARQKRSVAALAGSEAQFRATFDRAAVGIIHTSIDRCFLRVNKKFCDMVGYTRDELAAIRPRDITHPDDRGAYNDFQARLVSGRIETFSSEARFIHKDGSTIWVNRTISLVRDAAGAPLYFIRVIEDITERKQLQLDLEHVAHHDSLTGLPNRELFYDRLEFALEQARRRNWTTGVMFIDLDRFKEVNDTLGHGVGDQLLQQVAARLAQCVRADDSVGRLGGDEFGVILSELAHDADGSFVARKIIDALSQPFQIDGNEVFVTASIGITSCPPDSADADTLVRNADTAMYEAKKAGKNNFQFYTAAANERANEKLTLESDLRQALKRNEFVLHFQPKAHLITGRITGMEALLRWQRPKGALVPPAEFVPMLEETGLIVPAGEWVVRAACAQISAWQAAGLTPLPVAINLSAKQFHQQDICDMVMRALRAYNVDPRLLEVEITESAAMQNVVQTAATLHSLKALGVRIAIDDFGTGYSSLSHLKRFPIDSLKIDRSFVTDLPGNADDASIAQAVITMAHALRLKVIAEGVENEAQLEFLAANGCDEMQGYFFSRPLPVDDCTQLLREQHKLPLRQRRVGAAISMGDAPVGKRASVQHVRENFDNFSPGSIVDLQSKLHRSPLEIHATPPVAFL